MPPRQGRLQPGHPRAEHPQPAHHLPGHRLAGPRLPCQHSRHHLQLECTLSEPRQWGLSLSMHLLPGPHQLPGPPGRAQVRGLLQGRQEGQGSRPKAERLCWGRISKLGAHCFSSSSWMTTSGKEGQWSGWAVGDLGSWGQKETMTRKPKTVGNWGKCGKA